MKTSEAAKLLGEGPEAWRGYGALFVELWSDVKPLIGAITLSALYTSAIRNAAQEVPELAGLRVSVAGPDAEALRVLLEGLGPERGLLAASNLVQHLMSIFESVAGPIIVRQVMPKVIAAEQHAGTLA